MSRDWKNQLIRVSVTKGLKGPTVRAYKVRDSPDRGADKF